MGFFSFGGIFKLANSFTQTTANAGNAAGSEKQQ